MLPQCPNIRTMTHFEIHMHNIFVMHVLQCLQELSHEKGDPRFWHAFVGHNTVQQAAARNAKNEKHTGPLQNDRNPLAELPVSIQILLTFLELEEKANRP